MKALLHPVVAVVVCVAAAVCFAAAAQLHAMNRTELSNAAEALELSVSTAVTAAHKAWSAVDFWLP